MSRLPIALLALALLWAMPIRAELDPEVLRSFKKVEREGQEMLGIGLQDILKLALERATSLQVSKLETEMAQKDWRHLQGSNPLVWTNEMTQQRTGSILSSSFFSSEETEALAYSRTDTTITSTGLSYKLKWGLSYGLTYQKASKESSLAYLTAADQPLSDFTDLDTPFYTDSLIAEMKLPLLKGFGSIGYIAEERGQAVYVQAQMKEDLAQRGLLREIGGEYWNLVAVQMNIETRKQAKQLAQKFLKDSKVRYKLGRLGSTEVTLAQSQLALAEQNLLSEEIKKTRIEDKIRAFLNLQGLQVAYWATEIPSIKTQPMEEEKLLEMALTKDPDLKMIQAGLAISQLDLKEAEDQDLSDLALNISYQKNGYGASSGEAGQGINRQEATDYKMGLTWEIPLFDHQAGRKVTRAQLQSQKLELEFGNQKAFTEVTLQSALQGIKLGAQAIQLAQVGTRLTLELLTKEEAKFRVGKSTSFRVAQAQQDLAEARMKENQALTDYEKAYLELMILTGQAMTHYQLTP